LPWRDDSNSAGTRLALPRDALSDVVDPLRPEERAAQIARRRPRTLPLAPLAKPGRRSLPLADSARPIDQRWRPSYVVWEITLACDLACRHCGSRAGRERPDELDTAEALDLARQVADLGAPEVTLIGGEAYLRDDWLAIVRTLAERGVNVSMTTGGRGLTFERARAAKEAGLAGIGVSIDGDEAVHDRLRGVAGSYESALQAVRNATAAGLPVSCNTQLNRLSIPHLPAIVEVMAELGIHSWQIQLTVPMGRAADEPEVLVQPYDLLTLFPLLAQLKARCDELGIRVWTGNNVGYFGPHETALRGHYPYGRGGQCGAGRASLGIEANGAIKGCPSLPTLAYTGGNIRDASLKDIWERSAPLRVTRDRTIEDLWGFCRTCYYAEDCMAGCMWTSHMYFGRPGNNPFCHHRALEMQRGGQRERVERVAPAPGQPFDHGLFRIVVENLETPS
jgi:radical SAM protein with 4Fe4S-binding SPASM domain